VRDSVVEEAKARGKREGRQQGLATGRLARAKLRAQNAALVVRFKRRTGQLRRLKEAAAAVTDGPWTDTNGYESVSNEALDRLRAVLREVRR
jgi:hypothetical protein